MRRNWDGCAALLLACCLICAGCSKKKSSGTTAGAGAGTSASAAGQGAGSAAKGGGTATAIGGKSGSNAGSGGTKGGGSAGKAGATSAGGSGTAGGGSPVATGASVLQHHKNATRDGLYIDAAFTKAAAAMLHRDKSFTAKVTGAVYAQPLYFEGGPGGKDLVIVATEQNEVSALDAANGSVVWQRKSDVLGMPAASAMQSGGCGNIHPLGITGTPIIDAASRTLYFDTMNTAGKHMIQALSLDDGTSPSGWPVDVSTVKAGAVSFNSPPQNERGALAILNGTLYVPYGGHYGDCGDYHGWVVGVPLDKPSGAFGWATRGSAGGIWAPSGVASDGKSLFVATGNTMRASSWADGEAVIKLSTDLKSSQADPDYFAAMNWSALDGGDTDIGGTGPVLFSVPGATPSELAIALGKDGKAYLLDRANMGGVGKPLDSLSVASQQIINAAAAYTTGKATYVVLKTYFGNLTALQITAAAPPKITMAWSANPGGQGSPMVTTTDGKSDAIVWYVAAGGDNKLRGYDGDTGMPVFTGGGADEQLMTVDRFQTPIAAKGRIFVAAENNVYAFTVN